MLRETDVDQKEIVFVGVPGHAGIQGNAAADTAAKAALSRKSYRRSHAPFQTESL